MGRTIGAKNKKTLILELRKLGRNDNFEGLTCAALQFELNKEINGESHVEAVPIAPPIAPPIETHPILDTEVAKTLIASARATFEDLIENYAPGKKDLRGGDIQIPESVQDCLRKVFFVANMEEAEVVIKRAHERMFFHLLNLWSTKKIAGPNTPRNVKARADAADSWATRLEKQGRFEDARKQREKAAALRANYSSLMEK